ncbi:Disheveled-associated activator of morphogenesis 1, partial [Cladochytrium tenue]
MSKKKVSLGSLVPGGGSPAGARHSTAGTSPLQPRSSIDEDGGGGGRSSASGSPAARAGVLGTPRKSSALRHPPSGADLAVSSPISSPVSHAASPQAGASPMTAGGRPPSGVVANPTPASMYSMSDVPMPPLEAVNTMLELLMEDLNLTEEKKQVLRLLSSERKWIMLQQHLGERYRDGASRDIQQEMQEINRLRDSPDRELLTNLVVSLRSRPIRWISNFIDNGGLSILLNNLRELEEENRHDEFEELYIKCLKSLMNNKIGLSAVLDNEGALNVIALSLRSPSARTRALVLEIFGAVCLIPGGHKCVLEGMDALAETAGIRSRFEAVVYCLWQ